MTKSKTPDRFALPIEEYVVSLYRILLKREPDSEGLRNYVRSFQENGDHTKILNSILLSPEFHLAQLRNNNDDDDGFVHAKLPTPFTAEGHQNALSTEQIIECSRDHFVDLPFIKNLGQRSGIFGRTKRAIKTIGVYYPKLKNGGTERVTSRQILAWKSLGYDVILITDLPKDPDNDYEYGDVPRFIIPPKMMLNHDYRPRGIALAKVLREQNVDLFVNNLWDETSTVWDVLVAKSLGIPVVVGWHNIFDTRIRRPSDLHLANIRFAGYKYADLVTVLGTVDRLWFRDRGVAARVVYNPLPFDALPSETASLKGKTVVWVARADRHQKRLDLAIRMFPLVLAKVPDAKLVIVGDGPDLEWAKQYAHSLNIANQVEFTGYTTDVAQYLRTSDVHILTSEFEGWCLSLGEAWAYGIPSVMFELPYLEYVQSRKGYIAVEMLDVSAMANAVSELLLDEDLRRKLGREAREVIEDFDRVSHVEEWRKIITDIETKDDLEAPLSAEQELRGLQTLTRVLGDRLLTLKTPEPDTYVPAVPSNVWQPPKRGISRLLLNAARTASVPYVLAKREIKRALVPDSRLKMIDLSHVGLGDNLMIWTGLFTMLSNGVPLCAPGCVMHVQPILAELGTRLFGKFGLVIKAGRPARQISPIYTPLPPTNRKEWWGTYIGRDWRMNWVEALDRQKTFPRHGEDSSFNARVRLSISERLLYKRHSWMEAVPGYIGYRVWLPLARKHGIFPIVFLTQIKRALAPMRQIIADYVDEMTPPAERFRYSGNAAFPSGKSFQTIPPKVFDEVNGKLGGDFFACYIQDDSPWQIDYRNAGVKTQSLSDIRDTFRIIKYSKNLLTTDSFTSHLAQLLRDDFVLVLSRDLQESIVHPGAHPTIVANHPACAPCNYQERYHFDRCVAGYQHCLAFEHAEFRKSIADCFAPQRVS